MKARELEGVGGSWRGLKELLLINRVGDDITHAWLHPVASEEPAIPGQSRVSSKIPPSVCHNFRHMPPKQLSPAAQEFPQRPQFCESLVKVALLTHLPMHISEPGEQLQKPPVQLSEKEQ